MGWVLIVIILLFVIILFVAIAIALYFFFRPDTEPVVSPVAPPTDYNKLIDITNQPCCVVNGSVVDLVYVAELGALVGPNPIVASRACLNNTVIGFDECETLIVPSVEGRTANPVAKKTTVNGLKLYYINRSTTTPCQKGPVC